MTSVIVNSGMNISVQTLQFSDRNEHCEKASAYCINFRVTDILFITGSCRTPPPPARVSIPIRKYTNIERRQVLM